MSFLPPGEQSPPIFTRPWLDALTRTPWWVVPLVYGPAVIWLLSYSLWNLELSLAGVAGVGLAGLLAWTFVEYWLHRTLFHWVPGISWGPRMHFLMHGVHHDKPHDPYRLVMPLPVSAILFVAFFLLWTALLGAWGWGFHAGFVLGYLIYDITHYAIHHSRPRSVWMKRLRRHHLSHHFNDRYEERRFGVSTTFWDRFFGTEAPKER